MPICRLDMASPNGERCSYTSNPTILTTPGATGGLVYLRVSDAEALHAE
jgi:hypothetical protein